MKVAEENGNQYAAFRAAENLWTLCGTRNVSSAEIADAKSLVLSFRLRWEEGSMQHGRLVLLGLDEEGLQYPSNNDDGDDYKELMYFTDTHFITPHSSGGPGGNMQYRSSATEPTRWIDVQIQYVSEGETTHTYARSKDASQAWGSAWTDLGVNKIFNFRDAANLTAVLPVIIPTPAVLPPMVLTTSALPLIKKICLPSS